MAESSKLTIMVVVMVIASFTLQSTVAQTSHVVGGTFGWGVPTSNGGGNAVYTTWASRQTFNVGDSLLFNFTTGFHDVAEVTEAAYEGCIKTEPTISNHTTGPATLNLTMIGNHYYICTVGPHCTLGQKLTINVAAGDTATPPVSTTPPPPSPSGASRFIAVLHVTIVAAVVALFY